MPNIKQQKKRVRTAAKERLENLRYRSTAKTLANAMLLNPIGALLQQYPLQSHQHAAGHLAVAAAMATEIYTPRRTTATYAHAATVPRGARASANSAGW